MEARNKSLAKAIHIAKVAFVHTIGRMQAVQKSPDEAYRRLFADVRQASLFVDGKVFADLVPRRSMTMMSNKYEQARKKADFDLREFINDNFYEIAPKKPPDIAESDSETTPREYVRELWPYLEWHNRRDRGSLIALPHPYIIPGGRFNEQFYWDSYFIMLGLAADGHWDKIYAMMRNYAYMMSKFKIIPTANRTYFVSRSQPPFLALMVRLLAEEYGKNAYVEFLPTLLAEYHFWMRGTKRAVAEGYSRRVVSMPADGAILNRYFDSKSTPRPDVGGADLLTAAHANRDEKELFTNIRAGAESGWDFSSRWFGDSATIGSIITIELIPVDLNSLLYVLEMTIARAYRYIKLQRVAKRFQDVAEQRAQAIRRYCWNAEEGWFYDYNFQKQTQSPEATLAAVFPLYANLATAEQAAQVAIRLERDFLKPGGLVTTLKHTGQQWDFPNGWAPLQWVAIQALRNYDYDELATKIREAWLNANEVLFATQHKLVEKYDVLHLGVIGEGGEYDPQEGFGWTNGVYAALKDEQRLESA